MTNKKWFPPLLIVIVSVILFIATAPLSGDYITIGTIEGYSQSALVGFIGYYILTIFFLRKYEDKLSKSRIIICIIIGIWLLILPYRILNFQSTFPTLPGDIIPTIAVLLAYVCYLCKPRVRVVITIFSLICGAWLSITAYEMWNQKMSFGSFTGKVDDKIEYDIQLQTAVGDSLSLSSFSGKYLVIDCWYTHCGVCYEKFPQFQDLYSKYKDNAQVEIIALHSRLEEVDEVIAAYNNIFVEDYTTGQRILQDRGYTFPCLSVDIESPILKQLGVTCYPTILIFDKDSKLIFRGDTKFAREFIDDLAL